MIKIEIDDVTVNNTRCCLFILSGLFLPLPIRVVLFNDFFSMFHFFNASLIHKKKKCYVDFSDILFFLFWMLTVGNLTISFARSHIVGYYFINEERNEQNNKKNREISYTHAFLFTILRFYNVTKNVFLKS
ncbi:hypothetical protein ACKWTF_003118 [Chironomus riparius]